MLIERRCNYCGSPLPEIRLGVRLPPIKARVFDIIQRAGKDGIMHADLMAMTGMNRQGLRSHFTQINQLISGSGYRLYSRARCVFLINGPPPRKRWWRKDKSMDSPRES